MVMASEVPTNKNTHRFLSRIRLQWLEWGERGMELMAGRVSSLRVENAFFIFKPESYDCGGEPIEGLSKASLLLDPLKSLFERYCRSSMQDRVAKACRSKPPVRTLRVFVLN